MLEFRSSNTHRPVLDALELIGRHASGNRSYNPVAEDVPLHAGPRDLDLEPARPGRLRDVLEHQGVHIHQR